jgi:ipoprotein LpqH
VKRELLFALGAATIAVASMAGCSNGDKSSGATSSVSTSSGAPASSSPPTVSGSTSSAAAPATVSVDGQPKTVDGPVVCSTTDGKFSIAIGEVITGVIVGLEPDASAVHSVGLGDVNGTVLSFTEGVPGNDATATNDGKHYTITGTATGSDNANQQVSKPFTIDVTCP